MEHTQKFRRDFLTRHANVVAELGLAPHSRLRQEFLRLSFSVFGMVVNVRTPARMTASGAACITNASRMEQDTASVKELTRTTGQKGQASIDTSSTSAAA